MVLVVLAVIVLAWTGIHHILVRPLNRMIDHIKQIAAGDLTQQIVVTSRNEMGVLAASLKHMQSELIETVSGVRQGADAIYSSASEIPRATTISPPAPSSRPLRWKRPPPAWNS